MRCPKDREESLLRKKTIIHPLEHTSVRYDSGVFYTSALCFIVFLTFLRWDRLQCDAKT